MKKKFVHGIFVNKYSGKKLVYYPCPKNANSSAKLFFADHLGIKNNFIFVSDKIPAFKQTVNDYKGKENLVNFLPSKQKFSQIIADEKCCIIRDPMERFISTYRNRILYHKDLIFRNFSIDMVIEKISIGLFENKHFLPQNYFLGPSLDYYTFYANTNNLKKFEKKVNEFFDKNISFPKIQIGGQNFKIELSNSQIKKIKKIYEKDYDIFGL
tara:strand:+ start:83 stop:718 length:636 start_codon:yes stop_codon:yes gene_type:complete